MEAELQAEIERAMMEEDRQILEDAVRVSAGRQAKAEAIRVDRERQVKADWKSAEDDASRMEA